MVTDVPFTGSCPVTKCLNGETRLNASIFRSAVQLAGQTNMNFTDECDALCERSDDMLAEPEMRHGAAFHGKQPGIEQRFREKAQRLWSLLRHGLQETKQKMKREDLQPQVLHHGPQLLCHMPFTNGLKCATYIPTLHCFVTIDSAGYIQLQNREGHVVKHAHFTWPLCGALYAWEVQHYVVWNNEEMLLLDQSLSLVSRCPVPQGVTCSVYDSGRNQVLCGGCGGVTVWTFSQSGRNLSHYRSLSQGMTDQDTVTLVALDTTSLLPQSCFAVCKTCVWEYDLNTGDLLRVQKNLHLRKITGLLHSEFLRLLISGSRDGSIKIWNRDAQLKSVYLGHTGPVTALALDVHAMTVFSGSEDSTLRTWDLESHEQVGEQQMTGTVLRLETFSEDEIYVVSQTMCFLDVWRVRKLYQLNAIMGTVVTDIKMSHRHHPSRALCVCDDSAVRLIAAGTGDVISTLLLDRGSRPLGAEYCELTDSVYVLLEQGDFIRANVRLNPMSIESQIKLGSPGVPPLCFTLFSNRKDEARASMEKGEPKSTNAGQQPGDVRRDELFLIVVGKGDGTLSVFEWGKSSESFHFDAHCPAKVTSVISSPKENFILTAGSDLTIKVWRYFPRVEECFGLCLSFSCSHSVGLMCVLKSRLFVAFSDPSTATYSLVQYDLQTQTRKDHSRGDDHLDQVTGLCPCTEVGIVATCGRDGTIRIWNQENQLLRTLCLNVIPESLTFNKDRAELLVGIHSHVYHIDLTRLLPMPYRFKLQLMRLESSTDPPIPIPDARLKLMSEDDRTRLTKPHACTLRGNESPHKTWWEELKKLQETKAQSEEHVRISARDQELQLLQEGRMRRHKKHPRIGKKLKREAMERYLQLLYGDRPSIKVPDFDSFEPDSLQMPPAAKPEEAPFMPCQGNRGFFSDSALGLSIQNLPRELQFPFQVLRWIPNSAILPMILPFQFLEKEQKAEGRMWRRLELFQNAFTDAADTELSGRDEGEEDVEETAIEELVENEDILQKISQYEIKQNLPPSVDESLEPLPANEEEKEPRVQRAPQTQIKKVQRLLPSLLPNPRPQPHRMKSPVRPAHPVPPVLPEPVVLEPSPSPTHEVLEPRHEPSLPLFMLQFQETSWFSRIFPESQVERPPASEKECVSRLLQGLLHIGHPVRVEILQALGTLFHQGHIQASKEVLATLLQALNPFPELNLQLSEDQEFVFSALRFLVHLFPGEKDVILELLVMCVQESPSHRPALLNLFSEMGVQDPHGFLKRKVNLWDNWEAMDRSRVSLRHQCARWLESWTSRLKDYVAQSLDVSQSRSPAGRQGTRILKGRARALAQREQDMFEVTPVDALNYYCEVQMMKETQRQKKEPHAERSTVLALPPIHRRRALLRLGEDNLSGRRRDLDDVFLPCVPRPPPPGLIPFINLPMKKISLCPFSSVMDSSVAPYLTGSLKPDAHRYFVVHRSYARSYS